ncbi:restriction endonuclease subunit S [Xanthocytophaga flava]|uniref:restriction endonuclease subunit S n=1 Tax=Xanthocytophaga flava TaxID=3048013 RepID=UPI0028D2F7BC|nr:restriction endonuclease subunit S [Xanthocytophaga flavus]MDJ1472447.1 restriction endonuclease subunit S [Xanthocytophaga flavus]
MIKKIKIADFTEIRFGLYEQSSPTGEVAYLQVKQFNEEGVMVRPPDEFIELTPKNQTHILLDGDILFAGKGNRLVAWCYRQIDKPAIASSIFFVLRPDLTKVYPEYLVAILNAPSSKEAFRQIGAGTNILSIRKSELGAFEVPLPALEQQQKIAALAAIHQQEIVLAEQLIQQKKQLYTAVISQLVK